ncbi:MAG: aldehyde ferredoxin oxidoreductase N-terminal domain-containing protein [Dehalococcoidia bacterium]|nr:aldehyde ferredoxin oxidoreductase N-terminal domain-containing protein [Dehalococcoidia bacterium]
MSRETYGRGRILKVDLTSRNVTTMPIPTDVARRFIGGEGINSWLLWEHFLNVDPRIDPISPGNVIIAGMGPLGATGYGGGSKMKWTFKSPRTKFFGDSASGGTFGANLRWAGYDHLVVTGRAEHPVYIWINDDTVEIRDARHLWGKNPEEADKLIKEETGFADAETACIGAAGENLVTFATLQVSRHRAAGRAGAGCVFGSKNLKAIAARGTKGIPVSDPAGFLKAIDDMREALNKNERVRSSFKSVGTLGFFSYYNRTQNLPYKNLQHSTMSREKADLINARSYADNLAVRSITCSPGCISGCSGQYKIKGDESPAAGKYAGETGHRFELAAQIGWGACATYRTWRRWRTCGRWAVLSPSITSRFPFAAPS